MYNEATQLEQSSLLRFVSRWGRYFEMRIPDGALPAIPGALLAWSPQAGSEFLLRASLILVYYYFVLLFIHGADAIVGYLRGVDQHVYERGGVVKEPKLLVTREVRMREAALMTGLVGAVVVALSVYFAVVLDYRAFLMAVGLAAFAGQYSIGLRLSYRGMGEVVVGSSGLVAAVTYVALTHRFDAGAFWLSAFLGFSFAGVNLNSNHADYEYDAAAGRGTLAVRLGLRFHRYVGVAFSVAAWLSYLMTIGTGVLPGIAALAMVVGVPRHVGQLRRLFAGDPIEARRVGFQTHRAMIAVICVFGLVRASALAQSA